MLEQGRGSIINTASFVAVMGAATSQISYTASKGGVLSMSRELGVQFARAGRPGQRAVPRPGQHPAAAGAVRQGPGAGRAPAGAHPGRPVRRARGDRQRGAVPRQRRVQLHHRVDVPGRRRHLRRLRHPAVSVATGARPVIGITCYVERASRGRLDRPARRRCCRTTTCGTSSAREPSRCWSRRGRTPTRTSRRRCSSAWTGSSSPAAPTSTPSRYGAAPHPRVQEARPERDALELALAAASQPCRACRCSASAAACRSWRSQAGGTLEQHLPDRVGHDRHSPGPGVYGSHPVRTVPGTRVAPAAGGGGGRRQLPPPVGARPTPATRPRPGPTTARWRRWRTRSARFRLAVQWHPETGQDARLFEALVAAAAAGVTQGAPLRPHPETAVHSPDTRWQAASCEDLLGRRGHRHPHSRLARRAPPAARPPEPGGFFCCRSTPRSVRHRAAGRRRQPGSSRTGHGVPRAHRAGGPGQPAPWTGTKRCDRDENDDERPARLRHHPARRRAAGGPHPLGRRQAGHRRAPGRRSGSASSRAAGPAPTPRTPSSSPGRGRSSALRHATLAAFGATRRAGDVGRAATRRCGRCSTRAPRS